MFCKFESLGEPNYFYEMHAKLTSLCNDLNALNTYFSDYMYALTSTEYENSKQDLETIRIRVEAMSETAINFSEISN